MALIAELEKRSVFAVLEVAQHLLPGVDPG
jgi:hypothetical protein